MVKINTKVKYNNGGALVRKNTTDSGADVIATGYSKITPIFEEIDGVKVKIDGKVEDPRYFDQTGEKHIIIQPGETLMLKTGVSLDMTAEVKEIDENTMEVLEAISRPRSGNSLKRDLHVHEGTIDNEYVGEIGTIVTNVGQHPVKVDAFERVAQLVFNEVLVNKDKLDESGELTETERGSTGFGNSGKF